MLLKSQLAIFFYYYYFFYDFKFPSKKKKKIDNLIRVWLVKKVDPRPKNIDPLFKWSKIRREFVLSERTNFYFCYRHFYLLVCVIWSPFES